MIMATIKITMADLINFFTHHNKHEDESVLFFRFHILCETITVSIFHYVIKETISIQTDKEEHRHRMGWSHTHVWWIKIWEGYRRSKESQPHIRSPRPGFQHQEDKSPQLLSAKTSRD